MVESVAVVAVSRRVETRGRANCATSPSRPLDAPTDPVCERSGKVMTCESASWDPSIAIVIVRVVPVVRGWCLLSHPLLLGAAKVNRGSGRGDGAAPRRVHFRRTAPRRRRRHRHRHCTLPRADKILTSPLPPSLSRSIALSQLVFVCRDTLPRTHSPPPSCSLILYDSSPIAIAVSSVFIAFCSNVMYAPRVSRGDDIGIVSLGEHGGIPRVLRKSARKWIL